MGVSVAKRGARPHQRTGAILCMTTLQKGQSEKKLFIYHDAFIEGTRRAQGIAQETMGVVYGAMGLFGPRLLKAHSLPFASAKAPVFQ